MKRILLLFFLVFLSPVFGFSETCGSSFDVWGDEKYSPGVGWIPVYGDECPYSGVYRVASCERIKFVLKFSPSLTDAQAELVWSSLIACNLYSYGCPSYYQYAKMGNSRVEEQIRSIAKLGDKPLDTVYESCKGNFRWYAEKAGWEGDITLTYFTAGPDEFKWSYRQYWQYDRGDMTVQEAVKDQLDGTWFVGLGYMWIFVVVLAVLVFSLGFVYWRW